MKYPRILAAFVVLLTLIGVAAFASTLDPTADPAPQAAIAPATTTTEELDLEQLVEPGVLHEFAEAESDLTDEAISRSTSTTTTTTTTSTTTTTTPPSSTAATTAPSGKAKSSPTTSPPTTKAKSDSGYLSSAESDFASKINSYRSSKGLSSLKRDSSLNSYARSWAKTMAQKGLAHSGIASLIPPWNAVGENVGTGGSVQAIFGALKASSGHRANMLGDFTHFGVGVWRDGDGVLWTAHIFAR